MAALPVAAVLAGPIISAFRSSLGVVADVLEDVEKSERSIAIGVYNATGRVWTKGSVYFDFGTSDSLLPYEVCPNSSFKYTGRRAKNFNPTGVVGVIAYNMEGSGTRAIMFSVPWDTNVLYDPYWNRRNIKFSDPADAKTCYDMFKNL